MAIESKLVGDLQWHLVVVVGSNSGGNLGCFGSLCFWWIGGELGIGTRCWRLGRISNKVSRRAGYNLPLPYIGPE